MANLYRKIFNMQGHSVHVITLTWMSCVCITHLIAIEKLDLEKISSINFDGNAFNTIPSKYLFNNCERELSSLFNSPAPQEEKLPVFTINVEELSCELLNISQVIPQNSLAVTKDSLLQSGFLLLSKGHSPFHHSLSLKTPIIKPTWNDKEPLKVDLHHTFPSVELSSWLQAATLTSNIKTIIKKIGISLPSKEEFHVSLDIDEEKKGNIAFLLNDPKALISVLAVDPNFKQIAQDTTFKINFQLAYFDDSIENEISSYFPAYEVQNVYYLSSDALQLSLKEPSSAYYFEFGPSQDGSLLEELKHIPKNPELLSLVWEGELNLPLSNIKSDDDYLSIHKKAHEHQAKPEANITAFNSLLMAKSLHFLSPKVAASYKEPLFTIQKLKDRKPIFVEYSQSIASQKVETAPQLAIGSITSPELKLKEVPFDIKPIVSDLVDPSSEIQVNFTSESENTVTLALSSIHPNKKSEEINLAELPLIEQSESSSSEKKETAPHLAIDNLDKKHLPLNELPYDIKPLADYTADPSLQDTQKLYPKVEKTLALDLLCPSNATKDELALKKPDIELKDQTLSAPEKALVPYSELSTQEKLQMAKQSAIVAQEPENTFCFEEFMSAYQNHQWTVAQESKQKIETPPDHLGYVNLAFLETSHQLPLFVIGDQLATNFVKLEKPAKHTFDGLINSDLNIPSYGYKRIIPQSKTQYFEELTKKLPTHFTLSCEKNKTSVLESSKHVLRSLPKQGLKEATYLSLLVKNEEEFDPMRLCNVSSVDKTVSGDSKSEFLKKKALDYLALMPSLQQLQTYVLSTEFRNETEVIASPDGSSYYFAIKLRPYFPEDLRTIHQNFYFVIDQSRNISEERFESFKKSVLRALPYLSLDATFNLVILNKHCDVLNSTNLTYSKDTLDEAKQFLENISFGYLAAPQDYTKALKFIEEKFHPNTDEINNIILLTDGSAYKNYQSQKEKISQFCSQNTSRFNIYTVASAQDCHTSVLDLMSYHNNGQMLYSKSNAALSRQLAILIKNLKSPLATHLHLTTLQQEAEELEFFPPSGFLPALYADQPFVIYGKADRLGEIDLMIQGKVEDEWVNISQKINLRQAKKGDRELLRNCQLMEKKMHYFTEHSTSDET
jgi:hypothetical protein